MGKQRPHQVLDGEVVHAHGLERLPGRQRRCGQGSKVYHACRAGSLHGVEDRGALAKIDLETLGLVPVWRVTGSLKANHLVARSAEGWHQPRPDEARATRYECPAAAHLSP